MPRLRGWPAILRPCAGLRVLGLGPEPATGDARSPRRTARAGSDPLPERLAERAPLVRSGLQIDTGRQHGQRLRPIRTAQRIHPALLGRAVALLAVAGV